MELSQEWNADRFDIFLHKNVKDKDGKVKQVGKVGNVEVVACCGEARPDAY